MQACSAKFDRVYCLSPAVSLCRANCWPQFLPCPSRCFLGLAPAILLPPSSAPGSSFVHCSAVALPSPLPPPNFNIINFETVLYCQKEEYFVAWINHPPSYPSPMYGFCRISTDSRNSSCCKQPSRGPRPTQVQVGPEHGASQRSGWVTPYAFLTLKDGAKLLFRDVYAFLISQAIRKVTVSPQSQRHNLLSNMLIFANQKLKICCYSFHLHLSCNQCG